MKATCQTSAEALAGCRPARRAGLARVVLAALCASALAQAATLLRPPYVQNVLSDRGTILWTTLERGSGSVQYSADRSFSRSASAGVREFTASETGFAFSYHQYQADLTGLSAGAEYFYRVLLDGQVLQGQNVTPGEELRFRTAGPGPFTFLAFGDSGQGTVEQFQLAGRITRERPALVVHTGDVAYPQATFQEFDSYHFSSTYYLGLMQRVPFFPSLGNHEYLTNNAAPYLALHSLPTESVPAEDRERYYSFDWGNVHFIALDTNASLTNAVNGTGGMLEWLERDLQRTRQFWRVVYFHHAPYAGGPNQNDPLSALVRERVLPILDRHGVELVLNGHEHSYQRSKPIRNGAAVDPGAGTVYVTTGGGGASLYPVFPHDLVAFGRSVHHYLRGEVQGAQMTLRPINREGRDVEQAFTLSPPPLISQGSTVNAASFAPPVAPGALVSIFGARLGVEENQARSLPLPTELSGTSVTLNGRRIPLLYVSGGQINAQLPFDAQGPATLRVTTSNASGEASIMISETAPAIFTAVTEQGRIPAVLRSDGALVTLAAPAETGEGIAIFLTGLGQVNGEIAAGQPAPFSPLLTARAPVEAQLGGTSLTPFYAGLAPGFAGLYQVNVQVPRDLPSGTHALRIAAKGILSNTVELAVRSTAR